MKRKIVSKIVSAVLACAMMAAITGCGGASGDSADSGTEPGGETIELSFWSLQTRETAFSALTDEFNDANPDIHVSISHYDADGLKDVCKTAAQSGSLPSMWFNWGGALAQYYVDNGVTYDLTAYAEENDWADYFNAGALSLCTFSDKLSGYPVGYNVLGMYYRKDIFEANDISVPTSMEELDAACAKLKENGIVPISTAGLNGWHVMRLIEQFIEKEAGAELHDELQSLTASWDCEAVVNALEKYQEYCENEYFPAGFVTTSPDDTMIVFGNGSAAMIIEGQWYDGLLNSNDIDLNNVGWFPFPNGTGRMSAFGDMTQFNANLTDKELDAAIKYMSFLYSEESASKYPDVYSLPLPIDGAGMPEGQPHVSEMLENSSQNGTFTITDQAFPTEVADVLFQCQDAIAGGSMDPAVAAKNVQAAIEKYQTK